MSARVKRIIMWSVVVLILVLGLVGAFWPRALPVDLALAESGPMQLTVGDEGETRIVDVFVLSAPLTGRLRRIELEPGDHVVRGESIVVELEPTDAELLDPRSEAEAKAQLSAAESAASLAQAEVEKAEAELEFARSEVERSRELARDGSLSLRDLEADETALKARVATLAVAEATRQVRNFELERVRAQLLSPEELQAKRVDCGCLRLTSPVDGRVLRVLRESEGLVVAGTGLVEIGDPAELEIVVDLLSMDAVRVEPGQRAFVESWGGDERLEALVRRVEPFGFTKVSALGIEEKRVNVVLDIVSPPEQWSRLGHGYQVDVSIVLWESPDVLKVPLTSLFRNGEHWALFVSENGRAVQRDVDVGHRTDSEAEVLAGVAVGDEIVVYPGEGIEEGRRIAAR